MAAVLLSACGGKGLEGAWTEPVPGMAGQVQGVRLEKAGKASSINMATLQYERWERRADTLILSGKSIGNHQTISFTDTLLIDELTDSTLTLRRGGQSFRYRRQCN